MISKTQSVQNPLHTQAHSWNICLPPIASATTQASYDGFKWTRRQTSHSQGASRFKNPIFGNLYSLARIDEHKGLAARAVGYLFKQVFNALEATKRLQLLKHLFSNFVRGHASPLAKSLAKWTIPVEMEL